MMNNQLVHHSAFILHPSELFFHEFEDHHFRGVAMARAKLQHAGVTTGAGCKTGGDIIKQLFDNIVAAAEAAQNQSARCNFGRICRIRRTTGNRNHTLSITTDGFSLGPGGGDTLMGKELPDKSASQGYACALGSPKFITSYLMSHFVLLRNSRLVFQEALFAHLLAKFIETLLAKIANGHDGLIALFEQIEDITNSCDARTLE
jgi:hypothetical protein